MLSAFMIVDKRRIEQDAEAMRALAPGLGKRIENFQYYMNNPIEGGKKLFKHYASIHNIPYIGAFTATFFCYKSL
jgi:hypothetical protein